MHTSVALLLELGLILTALSALGALARRFALTPVPLYLLAGLALGEGGIAPVPAAGEFVEIGGAIGVVLLLLTLGLEFSVGELATSMRRHLPSAVVDLVLNATPGAIAGWLLGLNPVGQADCSLWRRCSNGKGKFGEDRLKPAARLSSVSEFVVASKAQ